MSDQIIVDNVYDLESVELPHLMGFPLRLFAGLLESPLRGLVTPSLFRNAGLTDLRSKHFEEPPTMFPLHYVEDPAPVSARLPEDQWPGVPDKVGPGFRFASVHDYARFYRQGDITPTDVAHKVLEAIDASEASDPPLKVFIAVDRDDVFRQAQESTCRHKEGRPLSIFDGVPVAVKDEVDMVPYPTTVGTSFLGAVPATQDAAVVARMRAAGALLLGKANMHEIGIGVTGLNPHHGTTRNPYAPNHFTGGSSSGPAAAVAAGFCPIAIGADGGGSVRVPASFCGLVGVKSTFGRVSEFGASPLVWTVAHLGPLAVTATDAALAYAVFSGPDRKDPHTLHQPEPTLQGWNNLDLSGLTLGVFGPWFRHANPEVVGICEALLAEFQRMGAGLCEITIPDLEAGRVAHTITIAGEMTQAMSHTYDAHQRDHCLDVRTNLALARLFTTRDYLQAQRIRTRVMDNFNRALEEADVIITPTVAITAPPIPPGALPDGESDLSTLMEVLRFTPPANMAGLPAISFPAGYDQAGLPVGMQAIGRPWQEHTLLRLALAAEQIVERAPPKVYYDILGS